MAGDLGRDLKHMHLTINDARFLFGLYLVLIVVGLYFPITWIVSGSPLDPHDDTALVYCASSALVGVGIFYSRKLYKALINSSYSFAGKGKDLDTESSLRRLGTKAYFLLRPFFSAAFSVVMYSLWRLSLSASGADSVVATDGFKFTTIVLGFISGFLSGRLIAAIEGYGARRVDGLLGSE